MANELSVKDALREMKFGPSAWLRWILTLAVLVVAGFHAHWSVVVILAGITITLELQNVINTLLIKALRLIGFGGMR